MTGKVRWTKTGTNPALTACAEPSSAIGVPTEFVGGTIETIADEMNGEKMNEKILETMNDKIKIKTKDVLCGTKSPRQVIADTELNDASGRTEAQTMGVAMTKNNVNGVVLDNVLTTNDSKLVHLDSDVTCQDCYEECPSGKTGTTMFC